jgi:hypothetical protein
MTPELFSSADETSDSGLTVQLCSMMSGFPTVAKPSPTRRPPDARVFSAISLIKYSIAIDPIKYIRIPLSFYYFKPDSNVVNKNRMPSKPSLPFSSIFGFHSHFVILSFGSRMRRTEVAPCLGPSRPNYELDFRSFQPPDLTPANTLYLPLLLRRHTRSAIGARSPALGGRAA